MLHYIQYYNALTLCMKLYQLYSWYSLQADGKHYWMLIKILYSLVYENLHQQLFYICCLLFVTVYYFCSSINSQTSKSKLFKVNSSKVSFLVLNFDSCHCSSTNRPGCSNSFILRLFTWACSQEPWQKSN